MTNEELWTQRLRARFPKETARRTNEELAPIVREALAVCAELGIDTDFDRQRFLALSVLITPEQKRSLLVEGTMIRVLGNSDQPIKKRLDFIYAQLVGRPVAHPELDLGPGFVPRRPGHERRE